MDRKEIPINALLTARLTNIILGILLLSFIAVIVWFILIPFAQEAISKERAILFGVFAGLLFIGMCVGVFTIKHVARITSDNQVEIFWGFLGYKINKKEFDKRNMVVSLTQNQEKFYVLRIGNEQTIMFEEIRPDKKSADQVFEWLQDFLA